MKRFFLITIEGRKYVNNKLTLLSTGVYELDCAEFEFYRLYVDGVFGAISTVPITLSDSLYTNYYDTLNKKLQIRLNASDLTNKKNFIVHHLIHVTNDLDLYWYLETDSPNTRKVIYQSRLNQVPTFGQSQENNLNGVLSFSASTIELDNHDQWLNKFFTDDDSFKGGEIKAWRCEDAPSNKRIVYRGTISRVEANDTISFTSEDFLNRLDKVLYSRGSYSNSIVAGRNQDTPDVQKQIKIHQVMGRCSSFGYKYEKATDEINLKVLDWQKMPEAYCVSYDSALTTSVNRSWETGIIEDRDGMEETYTVDNAVVVGTGAGAFALVIQLTTNDYNQFSIGDTFEVGSGKYGKVTDVYSNGIYVTPHTLVVNPAETIKINKVSALVLVTGGQTHYLHYKKDYTIFTPSAGMPIAIALNNNFEANYSLVDPLDPATDQIYYKLRNKANRASYSHGAQIKRLLLTEFDASEINATSFDDADVALDLDLCFMIPLLDDDFPNKRELLEKLLVSSFGYLYLDDQLKISYGNFKKPTPTSELTDVEIKKDSLSHSIDYDDVYQSVHFTHTEFTDSITLESDQATYLHKTNKQKDYEHLCDTVSVIKPIDHFKKITQILTMKKTITQLSVLEQPLRIGDERDINSSKKLGNTECVILSLEENDKESSLRSAQLEEAKGNIKYILNGISQGNV